MTSNLPRGLYLTRDVAAAIPCADCKAPLKESESGAMGEYSDGRPADLVCNACAKARFDRVTALLAKAHGGRHPNTRHDSECPGCNQEATDGK